MSDRNKGKPPAPQVQVIRRPAGTEAPATVAPVPVRPAAPVPRPAAVSVSPRPATPTAVSVSPRPASPTSVAPAPGASPSRPAAPAGARSGGPPRAGGRSFRPSTPRPPPTVEQINALAKQERVPARIAKGELEGKMKCRIWKKLHREEAGRFDQAYTLMEKHPSVELADAFGVVQSGLPIEEFMARRARVRRKEEIKQARATVPGETIDGFIAKLKAESIEAAFVLGERTLIDSLKEVQPVAFELTRTGRLEKLQVVVLTTKATWDALSATLERDPKLTQKPAIVARQPARRPVHDPRPFAEHVGQSLHIQLRNGLMLTQPLIAIGPFDVLLGTPGAELFVPLHAMMSWKVATA